MSTTRIRCQLNAPREWNCRAKRAISALFVEARWAVAAINPSKRTVSPIKFRARWKEELVCTSRLGSFVLEMPMGILSVYFPTEDAWRERAPDWAAPHWAEILSELEAWCAASEIPLYIDESAQVYEP